ncbi:MAG TPA: SPOR domain-containing protein [Bdellovibrionota bacterium]|nr:SPOR domain-containing protein [Bdellovibrionota bacterium]
MTRSRLVYLVVFPFVSLGLCAFSYYLGWSRAKQAISGNPAETGLSVTPPHPAQEELTFFKTLKEEQPTAGRALEAQEPTPKVAKVEPKMESKAARAIAISDEESKIPGGKGTMVVQVSAFRDIGKAHELIDSLKNQGFPAFARSGTKGKQEWHRVFVGPYADRTKADGAAKDLAAKGFGEGFVTQFSAQ